MDENKIVELYLAGDSIARIKEKYGSTDYTIHRILAKNNIAIRKQATFKSHLSEQDKLDIIQKYKENGNAKGLAREYKVCHTTIRRLLAKNQIKIKNTYELDDNYFENIDSEDKAYILGFIYADGHNNKLGTRITIGLSAKDIDILEKIRIRLFRNNDAPIRVWDRGFCEIKGRVIKEGKMCELHLHSTKISSDLTKIGCVHDKTYKCYLPNIDRKYMKDFIRGFLDGDGSIIHGVYQGYFRAIASICCRESFAKSLKEEVQEILNINSNIIVRKETSVVVTWSITKREDVITFLDWIYKDANIYLDRKYNKYLEAIQLYKEYREQKHGTRCQLK